MLTSFLSSWWQYSSSITLLVRASESLSPCGRCVLASISWQTPEKTSLGRKGWCTALASEPLPVTAWPCILGHLGESTRPGRKREAGAGAGAPYLSGVRPSSLRAPRSPASCSICTPISPGCGLSCCISQLDAGRAPLLRMVAGNEQCHTWASSCLTRWLKANAHDHINSHTFWGGSF